jgi:hypothetical protein
MNAVMKQVDSACGMGRGVEAKIQFTRERRSKGRTKEELKYQEEK